jgi:hypothetical protein
MSPSTVPSVIVFGLNEWNDNWQTRQYISSQLGKRGWSVVYTTGAGDLWLRRIAAWSAKRWNGYVEKRDHVQLYRSGKLDSRFRKVKTWDQWALRRHAGKLMKLADWSTASHRLYLSSNLLALYSTPGRLHCGVSRGRCVLSHARMERGISGTGEKACRTGQSLTRDLTGRSAPATKQCNTASTIPP